MSSLSINSDAPNFTADAPVNPVPAIATDVPPAAGPDVGAIDVTAAAAADEPFIKHLFKTSRAGDFAAAGLPDSVLDILLHQQFHAQAAGYAAQYPHAVSLIVLHGDARAGRLLLQTYERRWHMIDIVLLPSLRGQGLGTDIIETTAHAARRDGAAELTLSVLFNNAGARRLYGRLGFTETGDGVHVPMTRALRV